MVAANVSIPLNPFGSLRRLLGLAVAAIAAASLCAASPALAEGRGHGNGNGNGNGHGDGNWDHGGGWRREAGGPPGRARSNPDYGGPPGRTHNYPDYGGPQDRGGPQGRGGDRWGYGPPRQSYSSPYPGRPVYPYGAPPEARYGARRGGMLPPQYRGAIVPDYGRHHLRPPPPGFAWVRMGDGYALVSRDTGQIFDVIGR
jgi:Ni/Co efflux regulator RcnB